MIDLSNNTILITGAAGIVGQSAILECLKRGLYVRAIVFNRDINIIHKKLEIVRMDLENYNNCIEALKDIDICLHFAAFIKGAKGQSDASNFSSLVRKIFYQV